MDGSAVVGLVLMIVVMIILGLLGLVLGLLVTLAGAPWWIAILVGLAPIPTFFLWQITR